MDNSAFSKLVRDHSDKGSSNRDVARKAVESEFKRRKRKNRGDDYSDDDENERRGFRNKRQQRNIGAENDNNNEAAVDASSKYRDRAKERREGGDEGQSQIAKNEESVEVWLESVNPDQLSSDVVARMPTKGLNRSQLSRQPLLRSENGESDDDEAASLIPLAQPFETIEQAKAWLSTQTDSLRNSSNTFTRTMFEYLHPPAPVNVDEIEPIVVGGPSRSVLTFTTSAQPGDWPRAWEVPQENVYGGIIGDSDSNNGIIPKLSPITSDLCAQIGKACSRAAAQRLKSKLQQLKKPEGPECEQPKSVDEDDESDDDEDIFDDVGRDYDPFGSADDGKEHGEVE